MSKDIEPSRKSRFGVLPLLLFTLLASLFSVFFSSTIRGVGNEIYAVIDLKSFYSSCECASRGLDLFSTPLVVGDPDRGKNSIIMSVTPFLKEKYGVPNVCRIGDLPNVPGLIYAKPRMAYYMEMSAKVVSILLDFVSEEDLHVYSVDESFVKLTPYLNLYQCDAEELVRRIQERIRDELGLTATAGMGPNMFLAKACLDNEGKKRPPYRSYWGYEDVPTKLWKIRPITKVWGIAHGIASHLDRLGIRSLEELAKSSPLLIQKEFGIVGEDLRRLANGIDETNLSEKYIPKETSFSQGQVLMRDYSASEALLVLKEITDELCRRLRKHDQKTGHVSVYVGYSAKARQSGFCRGCSLNIATDDNDLLFETVCGLYWKFVVDAPIRNLVISFGKLSKFDVSQQLSLFHDNAHLSRKRNLRMALDAISDRYGRNAVLRASALLEHSTVIERHGLIGGHRA